MYNKYRVMLWGILLIILLTACRTERIALNPPTITPTAAPTATPIPFPDTDALHSWADKNTNTHLQAQLGNGAGYALTLSQDGKTIAVAGAFDLAAYDFNTLKERWRSPLSVGSGFDPGRSVKVVWSPTGNQLATLSNNDVILWDGETGQQIRKMNDLDRHIFGIYWSPDGHILAANVLGDDKSATLLWNMQTTQQDTAPEIIEGKTILSWAPNEAETIASHGKPGEFIFRNLLTGQESSTLVEGEIRDYVPWTIGPGQILSSQDAGQLSIWDATSGKKLQLAYKMPERGSAELLTWSPDHQFVAASNNNSIIIWNTQTREFLREIFRKQTGVTDKILSLAWSPDSKNLISLSKYKSITVWDVQTGKELRSLDDHTGEVLSMTWSPKGDQLASGSEDGEITIWDPVTGKKLLSFHNQYDFPYALAWSPDGKWLAAGGAYIITIWEVQTGKPFKLLRGPGRWVQGIAWSPDGTMLAATSSDSAVIIWNGSTFKEISVFKEPKMYATFDIAWSPQGNLFGTSYGPLDGNVALWDPKTGKTIRKKEDVEGLAWSPNSDLVASVWNTNAGGTPTRRLIVWNIITGEEIYNLDTYKDGLMILHAVWSPDGNLLLGGAIKGQEDDHLALIFEAKTGKVLHRLQGHKDMILKVAWSPRGDLVAASSQDGTVLVWGVDAP